MPRDKWELSCDTPPNDVLSRGPGNAAAGAPAGHGVL